MSVIEGQVSQLTGLVQQQDALNAVLKQRLQATGEAESRAKVPPVIWLSHCVTFHPDSASMRPVHAAVMTLPDALHCYLCSDAASQHLAQQFADWNTLVCLASDKVVSTIALTSLYALRLQHQLCFIDQDHLLCCMPLLWCALSSNRGVCWAGGGWSSQGRAEAPQKGDAEAQE